MYNLVEARAFLYEISMAKFFSTLRRLIKREERVGVDAMMREGERSDLRELRDRRKLCFTR